MLPAYLFLLLCTIAFSILVIIHARRRAAEREQTNQIWNTLSGLRSGRLFEGKELVALPDVAKRYFLTAIRPGTPVARSVVLRMKGEIRLNDNWTPFEAEQLLAPPHGFVWRARAGNRLLWFSGADAYSAGEGITRFSLWGLAPVVNATGSDIARSSAGRLAGEMLLLPSALLPSNGVKWSALGDTSAQATAAINGETIELRMAFEHNAMPKYVLFKRWYDKGVQAKWEYAPFGAEFSGVFSAGGYTIPRSVRAGWHFGTRTYHEFFRATIESAEFR